MGLLWPIDSKDFGKSVSIKSGIIELPGFFWGGVWKQRTSYWSFWEKTSPQTNRAWSLGWCDIREMSIVNPSKMDENGLINGVTEVLFHPFPVDPHRAPGSRNPQVDPNRAPAPRVTWRSDMGWSGHMGWFHPPKRVSFHEGKSPWKLTKA